MDFALIDKYLNFEIPVGNSELKDLEMLVADNPWFTLAHVLRLKTYRNENKQNYHESFRLTILYTPSRQRLYRFLEKESTSNKNPVPDKKDTLLTFRNEYFSPEDLSNEFLDKFSNNGNSKEEDLIINFIKKSPKIIPCKEIAIQNSGLDNALENSSIASETLAEIYLSQGFYEQSIECYRKLILLNPEKSIYFAGKIDEIKDIKK
jgi:tetratricopeptide (TPR) repeat protein